MAHTGGVPKESVVAESSAAAETYTVRCPFDGSPVGVLTKSSVATVEQVFGAARAAQRSWATTSMTQRTSVIARFADLVDQQQEELLDLVQLETGKARSSAAEELADIALWSAYLTRHGPSALRRRRRRGAFPLLTKTFEYQVPMGVVGVITPWNYPLTLPVTDSLPALLAGNAVVLKPDEQTSHVALRVVSLLEAAGLPAGLVQVVIGSGDIGTEVVDRSDFVMFTGSSATGHTVAQRCARRLIGFSAELGGKNPMLILDDADVNKAAAAAANSCFSNTGQLCVSIERIYVHASRWDEFTRAFLKRTADLKLASGLRWDADVGSLISARQLDAVEGHVDDAVHKGAQLLTGGRPRPDLGPYFYEPTVLTGVTDRMRVHREETFGPVVSLYRVNSDHETVNAANDSEYGLVASVWSRRRGTQVARQINAGSITINDGHAAAWASMDAPMGGFGRSGVGRRHGAVGIRKYTEAQTIARQRLMPIARPSAISAKKWAQLMLRSAKALRRLR